MNIGHIVAENIIGNTAHDHPGQRLGPKMFPGNTGKRIAGYIAAKTEEFLAADSGHDSESDNKF